MVEALLITTEQFRAFVARHALLAAESGHSEEPCGRRIAVDNPYEAPKASLPVKRARTCALAALTALCAETYSGNLVW